jgi:hypothetical protein
LKCQESSSIDSERLQGVLLHILLKILGRRFGGRYEGATCHVGCSSAKFDAEFVHVPLMQVLLVVDPDMTTQLPPNDCPDGVTPPMRKARSRHFRPPINIPKEMMEDAVTDVLEMLNGR